MDEVTAVQPLLIVNCYPDMNRFLKRVLDMAAYEADIVTTLVEGKERLAERPYSLLICRNMLGDGVGPDLIRHAWEQHRTPSLAITGVMSKEEMTALVSLPEALKGVLLVPFNIEEFFATLARVLGHKNRSPFSRTCPDCQGSGEIALLIHRKACSKCGGKGTISCRQSYSPPRAVHNAP